MLRTFILALALSISLVQYSNADGFFKHKGELSTRYKYQKGTTGAETTNDLQYHLDLGGGASAFREKTKLEFHAFTGKVFDNSWSNTGLGMHDSEFDFHVRHLWLTIGDFGGYSFMAGSMANEYGAGSADTSFDTDGWISGYRISRGGDTLAGSVTAGDLENYDTPSVFERTDDMGELNFVHTVLTHTQKGKYSGSVAHLWHNLGNTRHYVQLAYKMHSEDGMCTITLEDTYGVTKKSGNAFAASWAHKFSDSFKGTLSYWNKTGHMSLPLNDKVQEGHSVMASLKFPKTWQHGEILELVPFVAHVHNLSNSKAFRSEAGLALKF